jgi:hypothetical protein
VWGGVGGTVWGGRRNGVGGLGGTVWGGVGGTGWGGVGGTVWDVGTQGYCRVYPLLCAVRKVIRIFSSSSGKNGCCVLERGE